VDSGKWFDTMNSAKSKSSGELNGWQAGLELFAVAGPADASRECCRCRYSSNESSSGASLLDGWYSNRILLGIN